MLQLTAPATALASPEEATSRRSGAARAGVSVAVHRDLAAVEASWRALEADGRLTAFQRFDWVRLVVERLVSGPGRIALFAEVRDRSGRPAMILPLQAIRRRGVVTVGWLDGEVCDAAAPVTAADFAPDAAAMRAVWREVRARLPRADVLRVEKIGADLDGSPNPLLHLPGLRVMNAPAFGLPIAPPPEDLIQRSIRPSTFRDLAKFQRRLDKRGAVAFRLAGPSPGEVDAAVDAMLEQRRARFAVMGRFDLMSRPEVAGFYRAAARDGLAGGPARVFALTVDGETVATAYALVHGRTLTLLAQTMAGDGWSNCSPGVVVSARTMEWAAAAGLTFFDFSIGRLPYKVDLGGHERPLLEHAAALSPAGAAALGLDRALAFAKAELTRRPELFERLRALRRRIRRL